MSTTLEVPTTDRHAQTTEQSQPVRTIRPIWSPWADARRPSTAAEERRFRDRLADMTGPAPIREGRRADITALLNALRSGIDVEQLLVRAPGLKPARLAAAYDLLDDRRVASVHAWQMIAASTAPEALDEHGALAAMLVPRGLTLLAEARRLGLDSYARTLEEVRRAIRAAARTADDLEIQLNALAGDEDGQRAADVGRLLCAPHGSAIAERLDYLAVRVTMLSSRRVAALIDESSEFRAA